RGAPKPAKTPRSAWVFADERGRLAEGGALRGGSEMRWHDDRPPCVGVSGWVLCPSIGDALSRAVGPRIGRVTLEGPSAVDGPFVATSALRCLWIGDVRDALFAYADWCAAQALERERCSDPDAYAAFQQGVRHVRELSARDTPPDDIALARRRFNERFAPLW